jgi:hypothetical protein
MIRIIRLYAASFFREELEVTDDMADDIDLADLVPKVYEPISSWDVLRKKLIDHMKKMNEEIRGSHMDLVFFKDAMIHLLRVDGNHRLKFILTDNCIYSRFLVLLICLKGIYSWLDQ